MTKDNSSFYYYIVTLFRKWDFESLQIHEPANFHLLFNSIIQQDTTAPKIPLEETDEPSDDFARMTTSITDLFSPTVQFLPYINPRR